MPQIQLHKNLFHVEKCCSLNIFCYIQDLKSTQLTFSKRKKTKIIRLLEKRAKDSFKKDVGFPQLFFEFWSKLGQSNNILSDLYFSSFIFAIIFPGAKICSPSFLVLLDYKSSRHKKPFFTVILWIYESRPRFLHGAVKAQRDEEEKLRSCP